MEADGSEKRTRGALKLRVAKAERRRLHVAIANKFVQSFLPPPAQLENARGAERAKA